MRIVKVNLIVKLFWLIFVFLMIFALVFPKNIASSLSDEDLGSIYTDSVWYDRTSGTINPEDLCGPGSPGGGSIGNTQGTIERLMQAIAIHESGGRIDAGNPSGASGKYQFMPTTWQAFARAYYPPALQYSTAASAPEAVQDAVAYLVMAYYSIRDYNAGQIAVQWYYPAALLSDNTIDPQYMKNPPPYPGNVQGVGYFANEMTTWVSEGVARQTQYSYRSYANRQLSSIPIRYTTAPDFTTHLNRLGSPPKPLSLVIYGDDGKPTGSLPSGGSGGTVVVPGNCESGVPAGNFVFYEQGDPRWSGHPFGSSTIGPSGCGPTSLAMVVATLVDRNITPKETADYGTANGGYIEGTGSSWQVMFINGPRNWGLNSQSIGTNFTRARAILNAGGLIIASGTGASPFSSGGHIVVIRGTDSQGNFLIGNPAPGLQNSRDQAFSPSQLLGGGLANMWGITK